MSIFLASQDLDLFSFIRITVDEIDGITKALPEMDDDNGADISILNRGSPVILFHPSG